MSPVTSYYSIHDFQDDISSQFDEFKLTDSNDLAQFSYCLKNETKAAYGDSISKVEKAAMKGLTRCVSSWYKETSPDYINLIRTKIVIRFSTLEKKLGSSSWKKCDYIKTIELDGGLGLDSAKRSDYASNVKLEKGFEPILETTQRSIKGADLFAKIHKKIKSHNQKLVKFSVAVHYKAFKGKVTTVGGRVFALQKL